MIRQKLPRLDNLERFAIVFMCAVLIIVGLFPNSIMAIIQSGVQSILKSMNLG